jgi:hypothetical protein
MVLGDRERAADAKVLVRSEHLDVQPGWVVSAAAEAAVVVRGERSIPVLAFEDQRYSSDPRRMVS